MLKLERKLQQPGFFAEPAAGRAIELSEGERRAQFEASGFLVLGDGVGGKVGVFGGVGVRWVFLEEDVAARAVDLCIEPAIEARELMATRHIDSRD